MKRRGRQDGFDSLRRQIRCWAAEWKNTGGDRTRGPLTYWLNASKLSDSRRKGFERLRNRLKEHGFGRDFAIVLEEFRSRQMNPHALYFLSGEILSQEWDVPLPVIGDLRAMRELDANKKLSAIEAGASAFEELQPMLYRMAAAGIIGNFESHTENIAPLLRNLVKLSRDITSRAIDVGIIGARGRPPETFSTVLMATLPEYFTALTGSPQNVVTAQVRGLFGLSEDAQTVKEYAAKIRKTYARLDASEHPLVLVDKLFRA